MVYNESCGFKFLSNLGWFVRRCMFVCCFESGDFKIGCDESGIGGMVNLMWC